MARITKADTNKKFQIDRVGKSKIINHADSQKKFFYNSNQYTSIGSHKHLNEMIASSKKLMQSPTNSNGSHETQQHQLAFHANLIPTGHQI